MFPYLFPLAIPFLKVTFHLQLFQNIGYIPCVVQYILEPILHPVVCTSPKPLIFKWAHATQDTDHITQFP